MLFIIKESDFALINLEEIEEFERPQFTVRRIKDEEVYLVSAYAGCPEHIIEILEAIDEVECIDVENMAEWLDENGYEREEAEYE